MPPLFDDFPDDNPNAKVCYTGSVHDSVQRIFYGILGTDESEAYTIKDPEEYCRVVKGVGKASVNPRVKMAPFTNTSLTGYRTRAPNFLDFLTGTSQHCFVIRNEIADPDWAPAQTAYPAMDAAGNPITMWQFVGNFINDNERYGWGQPQYPESFPSRLQSGEEKDTTDEAEQQLLKIDEEAAADYIAQINMANSHGK